MTETPPVGRVGLPAGVRRALRWLGHAALLAAFVYLGAAFGRLDWAALAARFSLAGWLVTGLAAFAYAALLGLLASGWAGDAARGAAVPGWRGAIAAYGPGVIAKYIPGSVFQYASRQVLGGQAGWTQGAMLRASLHEAVLHLPSALLVAGTLALTQSPLALLVLAATGAGLATLSGTARPLVRTAGLQIVFFSGFGLVAAVLADSALGIGQAAALAAIFMLAWIAGFLLPLAPGGIGVRESALLLLAAPLADSATILAFALVTRLVTIAGDALFGLYAHASGLRCRARAQASA